MSHRLNLVRTVGAFTEQKQKQEHKQMTGRQEHAHKGAVLQEERGQWGMSRQEPMSGTGVYTRFRNFEFSQDQAFKHRYFSV